MKWQKLGKIFEPDGSINWMHTHASNPFALHLKGDVFCIFFSSRDAQNRSRIGYIELNINNPTEILKISEEPIFELGDVGSFDDSGASIGCILQNENKTYLYYLGWNLATNVPFRNSIGLAISESGEPFKKVGNGGPVLDRNAVDPYSLSYPFVIHENGKFRMWYGSHKKWGETTDDMVHCMKYVESENGIEWSPKETICLDTDDRDYAFSKPSVLQEKGIYKMWYSYRGHKYRIGYAESNDGITWLRKDNDCGIDVSESGWDSEMIEYPHVFAHNNNTYMLYNGKGYGKTGFGLALLA